MDPVRTRDNAAHAGANAFFKNTIIGRAAPRAVPCLSRYAFEAMLDVAGILTRPSCHTRGQASRFPRKGGATLLSAPTFQEVE